MRERLSSLLSAQNALRTCSRLRRKLSHYNSRMIVISAMPKSGSTFLSYTLAAVTGYKHSYFGCANYNIEQELYLPKLIDAYGLGTVTQQHFKANTPNLNLLNDYGIRPIVLVRNIFDVIVSAREHLIQKSIHKADHESLPAVYIDKEFSHLDVNQQIDFVIDMMAPWFLTYYVSWHNAAKDGFPFMWVYYEEARSDWPGIIKRVLDYCQIPKSMDDIVAALTAMSHKPRELVRLNQGIVGRGESTLSANQRERILRLLRYYPSVDFSPVGLIRPKG